MEYLVLRKLSWCRMVDRHQNNNGVWNSKVLGLILHLGVVVGDGCVVGL